MSTKVSPFRRLSRASLRHQYFAFAAAAMLLLGAAIAYAVERVAEAELKDGIGRDLSDAAFHMADKFDRGMWARSGELSVALGAIRTTRSTGVARDLLQQLQHSIPLFSWIGLLDPQGRVVAATGGVLEGDSIAHRPVYKEALSSPFIGDVHDAKLLAQRLPNPSGEPMRFVDISLPIHDDDGGLIGVLASHLSWEWAREIEESLTADDAGAPGMEIFVVDRSGAVLLAPRGMARFSQLDLDALRQAKTIKRGWTVEDWPDGGRYLTGYALEAGHKSYAGLGWTVLARRSLDDAYRPIHTIQAVVVLIGGLFAAGFTIAWWFVARGVAAPLEHLTKAADGLAQGRRDSLPVVDGPREIRQLSVSLRELVAALTSSEHRADRFENLAHHDRLTGLPNRLALEAVLEHLLPECQRDGKVAACLCLDLDGFKPINDTLGHQAGDEVLQQVATRLRGCLRGGDVVARLGGDEFVVVVAAHVAEWRDEAQSCADRIIASLRTPMAVSGGEAKVGTSIGIAAWPGDADEIHAVMALADQALYDAKRAGKNRAAFHRPETAGSAS